MESPPWSRRSGRPVAEAAKVQAKVLYLIGQFPAINHSYLLAEVRHLRSLGLEVPVVSISPPDRPPEKPSPVEREEATRSYYVKAVPAAQVAILHLGQFFRHPLRYLRGLVFAMGLAGGSPKQNAYPFAHFCQGILFRPPVG